MIVALGALELHAEEQAAHCRTHVLRLGFVGLIEADERLRIDVVRVRLDEPELAVLGVDGEGDGEEPADHFVDRDVVAELHPQPVLELEPRAGELDVGQGLGQPGGASHGRHVSGVAGHAKEALHEQAAFLGIRVFQEVARLGGFRYSADEVEVDAPNELRIIGRCRRPDAACRPVRGQVAVDDRGDRIGGIDLRRRWGSGIDREEGRRAK
jgi:hypothetical protein